MTKRIVLGLATFAFSLLLGATVFAQTSTPTATPTPTTTTPGGAPTTGFGP